MYLSEGRIASNAESVQGRFRHSISLSSAIALAIFPAPGVGGTPITDLLIARGVASQRLRFLVASLPATGVACMVESRTPDANCGVASNLDDVDVNMGVSATSKDLTTGVLSHPCRFLLEELLKDSESETTAPSLAGAGVVSHRRFRFPDSCVADEELTHVSALCSSFVNLACIASL